jgi:hypothetical protein
MIFNEQQLRFWNNMISTIEDFRKEKIQYATLVYSLEAMLDAGEYKNETLIKQWYDYWTPLEIISATKGNNVTVEEVNKYLSSMETFLRNTQS